MEESEMDFLRKENARLQARTNQLAACVRVQRQALRQIAENASDATTAQVAKNALREGKWS